MSPPEALAPARQVGATRQPVRAIPLVWSLYERLKEELTSTATTSVEYEYACRRAAQLAGV